MFDLSQLPNLRGGMLIFSSFFAALCVFIMVFTARSRAVQSGEYRFVEGQWFSIAGLFCFGLLFLFGYSLPTPADTRPVVVAPQPTEYEIKAAKYQNFLDACVDAINGAVSLQQRDACSALARKQADIALGQPAMRVVWKIREIDHSVGQRERADTFASFYDRCLGHFNYPDISNERDCTKMAWQQTDASYGQPHRDTMEPVRTQEDVQPESTGK